MNLTENRAPSCRAGDGGMKKPELLSPAGNLEKLKMALIYGADAVYLGGKSFGLRAFGGNFSEAEMEEGVRFAHALGRKVYVTLNIFAHNADLDRLPAYLSFLAEIHVDGLLVSDLGVFSLAREFAPSVPLHISTQANNTNWATVDAWQKLGAERVVLARELSRAEIAAIRAHSTVELEMFVHGAMCISYSGRCLLSSYLTGRDANRGACAQACRWRYGLVEESRPGEVFPIKEDERGTYIMNSKDLCLLPFLPELCAMGLDSLKIEGRMKSVHYAASVTKVYREAIDAAYDEGRTFHLRDSWLEELQKVSHRIYTSGFFDHVPDGGDQIYASASYEQTADFIGLVRHYDERTRMATVEQRNNMKVGQEIEVFQPTCETFCQRMAEMRDEAGEPISTAAHAQQIVRMHMEQPVEEYAILRRRREKG
ncbi:U32 family peptidase [Selenomonas sputigena]|uniref:peptidase U32 family protein n=1 Tax=Selenomonas sputigena TaxID=69823 RepID=UPI0028E201E2|nr:U32 family peptidase [Selenomonas sputigena]